MKNLFLLIFSLAIFFAKAQPVISNTTLTQTATNAYRYLVTFDTNLNAKAFVKAVNITNTNVPETNSYITDTAINHQIYYQGFIPNDTYEIYAVAFDTIGETQELVGTVIGDPNVGFEIITAPDTSAAFAGKELTFSTPKPNNLNGEKLLVWMDINGGITRIVEDPTPNIQFDCNNHLINDSLIVVVSCDSVNFYNNSDFTPISSKVNLEDSVIYHGKPILNPDGNLVFLNAQTNYVDKSFLPGGSDSTLMVSDGFMEYDFINDDTIHTWNAIEGFNPYQNVWLNGIYENKFPNAESWRLSNCVALGLNDDILMNHVLEQQVSEVSLYSGFPHFVMPSDNILVADQDELSDVRDFTSLKETGLYFTMANRYDSLITRCLEGFMQCDYQYCMFMSIRDYKLPANEWTPDISGGGLKIPSPDFHKVVMISGIDRISQVDETDVVDWKVDINNSAIPLSFVTAYNDVISEGELTQPVVEIYTVDSVLFIDTMNAVMDTFMIADTVFLEDMIFCDYGSGGQFPVTTNLDGGYFSGTNVQNGIIDIAILGVGVHEIIYNYGYVSDTVTITIEQCVGINDLYEMGGIKSSIYPNPMSNNATIRFELLEYGDVAIQIYNLQGDLIKNLDLGLQMNGMNMTNINVSDLDNGSYIYRLTSKNMYSQETFVVIK